MIFRFRVVAFLAIAAFAAPLLRSGGPVARAAVAQNASHDWPMMGFNVRGDNASPWSTGITAANVKTLRLRQVPLDGAVDASAIYLHGVTVKRAARDVFFVTTTYGKTIAVEADSGTILWEYTPPHYASWAGTPQITNSTPAADPDRHYIYAATPGGEVVKLAIADGHSIWSTPVTLAPQSEKMSAPLKVFGGQVIAVTGGYIGDRPPYQGHVAIVDASSGKLLNVWNSLCSNRSGLLQPASCDGQRSAIWGKSGPAIDEDTGDIFVATGNGSYDGKTNWGDSLVEINASATQMVGNYTPADNAEINRRDLDLGATSPVLMGDGVLAQGGKDALIRLVSVKNMAGTAPHAGHELQTVPTPGGLMLLSSLAKWTYNGRTWLFSADYGIFRSGGGVSAWTYASGRLTPAWKNDNPGTSPVVAGGLLYVYDGPSGGLRVYNAESGELLADLPCGKGHWNSPIVADGRIALPEGLTVGWVFGQGVAHNNTPSVLDIWSLPDRQK